MISTAPSNQRAQGVLLIVLSALVFSSAGIFAKGVQTDAWGIIFWRGLAAAGFTVFYLILRGDLRREIAAFGGPALAVTVISSLGTAAFIPAFKLTSVANVVLIYAAAPFVAAVLSWAFIAEPPTRRILISSVIAFGGVCLIVGGSVGSGSLAGDALALWMTLMMAGIMVIYRRYPNTTAALPAALSSVLLLPVALIFGSPMAATSADMPLLILFGLVFAVASVTLAEGARRLPAPETALLSALETPLAPLLALLILSEIPASTTMAGGGVILAAVLWSQWPARRP